MARLLSERGVFTDATKADERARAERSAGGDHGQEAGRGARSKVAAAQERAGAAYGRAGPREAHEIVAEASPARTVGGQRNPIRDPLVQVPHHVEGPARGDALAARAGGRRCERVAVAIGGPV